MGTISQQFSLQNREKKSAKLCPVDFRPNSAVILKPTRNYFRQNKKGDPLFSHTVIFWNVFLEFFFSSKKSALIAITYLNGLDIAKKKLPVRSGDHLFFHINSGSRVALYSVETQKQIIVYRFFCWLRLVRVCSLQTFYWTDEDGKPNKNCNCKVKMKQQHEKKTIHKTIPSYNARSKKNLFLWEWFHYQRYTKWVHLIKKNMNKHEKFLHRIVNFANYKWILFLELCRSSADRMRQLMAVAELDSYSERIRRKQ